MRWPVPYLACWPVACRSGRAAALAGLGAVTAVLGLLLAGVLPLNKQLWTPSYVLWTGGLAALALWLGHADRPEGMAGAGPALRRQCDHRVSGASVMSVALMASGAWSWIWQQLAAAMPQALELASMLQALAFVALWWGVAWWLDRRKIYLKI